MKTRENLIKLLVACFVGYEVKEVYVQGSDKKIKVIEFKFDDYPKSNIKALHSYNVNYFSQYKAKSQAGGFRMIYHEEAENFLKTEVFPKKKTTNKTAPAVVAEKKSNTFLNAVRKSVAPSK